MSDLMERLRTMAAGKSDDLDIAAEAIEEIIDLNWQIINLEKDRDELRAETARLRGNLADCAERAAYWKDRAEFSEDQLAQIAAHEKCCAGKWVKVTERLSGCGVLLGLSKLLRRKHDKR